MSCEEYQRIYMEGYIAGLKDGRAEGGEDLEKAYVEASDIMKRYGCGLNKAREIIRAVRHVTGGGGFGMAGKVKKAELLYWESIVDKNYLYRVSAGAAK